MANHSILKIPDKRLRLVSQPVVEFNEELQSLIWDMLDTLKANMGAGLAAPQINARQRVVVVKCNSLDYTHPFADELVEGALVFVNPEIQLSGQKITWEEACLSVPGYSGKVTRSELAHVRYFDPQGNVRMIEVGWPFSGVLQHECDHLDGTLYIDHDTSLKRKIYGDMREAHMRKVKEERRAKKELRRERLADFDPRKSHGPGKRQKKKRKKR
jgi:peptide deformylase